MIGGFLKKNLKNHPYPPPRPIWSYLFIIIYYFIVFYDVVG
jgi:hypothetical protein